ncbi:MAG: lipid-A-disaccharide synthase [Ignavibacteria bacterium]|nr:lipid-A-disaccharide synthase [Ignavibacteria bacterium]
MGRRIMIIAGEASGDLHGAGVVRELKSRDASLDIFGVGGDKMQKEGADLIYHVREIAVMGFWEVLRHLPIIRSMKHTLTQLLTLRRPDLVVLIDYPGFNLRFAPIAKRLGIKVVYYISPQVWAWHRSRVRTMRGVVDKMLVVFPFEQELYRREGIDATFVGHPLADVLASTMSRQDFCKRYDLDAGKEILAIFPGSREQEIAKMFEELLGAARLIARERNMEIAIGIAPTIPESYFTDYFALEDVRLIKGATYDLMNHASFALVKSGTGTLETAWFGTPMFVLYKTSWLTYLMGRFLVRTKHIGLVNIVAGSPVVPEFVQRRVRRNIIARKALALLRDPTALASMRSALSMVRNKLGNPGAAARVAHHVHEMIKT